MLFSYQQWGHLIKKCRAEEAYLASALLPRRRFQSLGSVLAFSTWSGDTGRETVTGEKIFRNVPFD